MMLLMPQSAKQCKWSSDSLSLFNCYRWCLKSVEQKNFVPHKIILGSFQLNPLGQKKRYVDDIRAQLFEKY